VIVRVAGSTLVWVALWGDPSPANFVWGVVLASALLWLVPDRSPSPARLRPLAVARLTGHMIVNLVTSSFSVVVAVLHPTAERTRATIVRVPLRTRSDLVASVVANSITMTPGTMTLSADPETFELEVHVIGPVDQADFVTRIAHLEDLVAASFGLGGRS